MHSKSSMLQGQWQLLLTTPLQSFYINWLHASIVYNFIRQEKLTAEVSEIWEVSEILLIICMAYDMSHINQSSFEHETKLY